MFSQRRIDDFSTFGRFSTILVDLIQILTRSKSVFGIFAIQIWWFLTKINDFEQFSWAPVHDFFEKYTFFERCLSVFAIFRDFFTNAAMFIWKRSRSVFVGFLEHFMSRNAWFWCVFYWVFAIILVLVLTTTPSIFVILHVFLFVFSLCFCTEK